MGKLLVENKADVNMVEASGHTALFVAVERGRILQIRDGNTLGLTVITPLDG